VFGHTAVPRPIATTAPILTLASSVEGDSWDGDYLIDATSQKPDPSSWNKAGACALDLEGGYTLNDLITDTNGSKGFSSHKAAVGTVPTSYYLQVTAGMSIPDKFILGRDPFRGPDSEIGSEAYQKKILAFLVVNRDMMLTAVTGLSVPHASFLALMRLNFVLAGGITSTLTERAVYVNEYTHTNKAWDANMSFAASRIVVEYIAETWLQYVGVLRHFFVVRGHHYKSDYDAVIKKLWGATTIDLPTGMDAPSWPNILRLGLHCFGIRSLNILVTDAYYSGKLAAALSLRFFAAPAGTAPVTTAWAGILTMKKALWWPLFEESYRQQIHELEALYVRVTQMGLKAHVNAKLFNWNWPSMRIDTSPVDAIAPLVLAFIDNLEAGESLRGQKCLTKRGDGGSAIRRSFGTSLINEERSSKFLESPEQFFKTKASEGQSTTTRTGS